MLSSMSLFEANNRGTDRLCIVMMAVEASKSSASTHSGEDSGVRLDISSCVGTVEAGSKVRQRLNTRLSSDKLLFKFCEI